VLLQQGPAHLGVIARGVERWIEQHEYTSLDELRGNMNHSRCPDPWAYTRSNYIRTLHNYAV
jgi:dihydroorotate dehydrogenase (fumarate)